jgi:predicted transcriptional regulator
MRFSDTEWTVLLPLWERAPATAREVHAAVGDANAWSYSTVRSLLARLVQKGALAEGRRGNQVLYTPRVTRTEAQRSALRSLVERAFGGRFGSLVQHLCEAERLTPSERRALERALDEAAGQETGEASVDTTPRGAPKAGAAAARDTRTRRRPR